MYGWFYREVVMMQQTPQPFHHIIQMEIGGVMSFSDVAWYPSGIFDSLAPTKSAKRFAVTRKIRNKKIGASTFICSESCRQMDEGSTMF